MVSDKKIFMGISQPSCLEPVAQLEPNFDGIVIGWSSSKMVSGSCALPPRWQPQCSCVVIESSFELESSSLCLYSSNLGTFWLKIEQFWPFEEISIFSNGGHLGYRTALTDTILRGTHPGTWQEVV
jgi:hypothetical protein